MKKGVKSLLGASTILFLLNVLASALNYLCQLVMMRVLSVESFGTVNTIFSFMMIVAVPGTTLTMTVAKYFAGANEESNRHGYLRKQFAVVLVLTFLVLAFLLVVQNALANILSIQDKIVLNFALVLAALGYFHPFYLGVFSGNKCFVLVGLYSLFIPLYKLIAVGVAYVCTNSDSLRLHVVLIGMIIGVFMTAGFGQVKAVHILGKVKDKKIFKDRIYSRGDIETLILNISLMLYMNVDLLCIRYYGDEMESGLYSSVLLFGRIAYYFATTLGTIILPSVADHGLSDKERDKILCRALLVMVLFFFVCMAPINIMKKFLIQLLFGANYLQGEKYVIYVSMISFALSIYTILINYVVGIGKTKMAAIVMLIVNTVIAGIVFCVKNITVLLICISGIGIVGAVIIYALCRRKNQD